MSMDRDLSPDEQILQATRQVAKDEKERREASEEELRLLHRAILDYMFGAITDRKLEEAQQRVEDYLREIGLIE